LEGHVVPQVRAFSFEFHKAVGRQVFPFQAYVWTHQRIDVSSRQEGLEGKEDTTGGSCLIASKGELSFPWNLLQTLFGFDAMWKGSPRSI
jgi:hypothetical protein